MHAAVKGKNRHAAFAPMPSFKSVKMQQRSKTSATIKGLSE